MSIGPQAADASLTKTRRSGENMGGLATFRDSPPVSRRSPPGWERLTINKAKGQYDGYTFNTRVRSPDPVSGVDAPLGAEPGRVQRPGVFARGAGADHRAKRGGDRRRLRDDGAARRYSELCADIRA